MVFNATLNNISVKSWRSVLLVYLIQHHVIKFVSDLRQVGGFLWVLVSSINKADYHEMTEILLKVALNTINQTIIKLSTFKLLKRKFTIFYLQFVFTSILFNIQVLVIRIHFLVILLNISSLYLCSVN